MAIRVHIVKETMLQMIFVKLKRFVCCYDMMCCAV